MLHSGHMSFGGDFTGIAHDFQLEVGLEDPEVGHHRVEEARIHGELIATGKFGRLQHIITIGVLGTEEDQLFRIPFFQQIGQIGGGLLVEGDLIHLIFLLEPGLVVDPRSE